MTDAQSVQAHHTLAEIALGLSILLLSACHRENDPTAPVAVQLPPEETQ